MILTRIMWAMLLCVVWARTAHSELQPPVIVDGVEWLQPVDFKKYDWQEVGSICKAGEGGLCTGSLDEKDLTGWTWASAQEVAALYNYFIGDEEFVSDSASPTVHLFEKGKAWAVDFFSAGFMADRIVGDDRYLAAYLRDETPYSSGPQFKLFGQVSMYFRPYCSSACSVAEVSESWDFHSENGPPAWGYWFYRPVNEGSAH